jgi:glycogen debranching enzyme
VTGLTLIDGSTFFVTGDDGDVSASGPDGLFHDDMRHLSLWQLHVDDQPVRSVQARAVDYYSGRVEAIPRSGGGHGHFPLWIRRDRFVSGGVHEDVEISNLGLDPRTARLGLRFGTDFADLQTIQRDRPPPSRVRGRVSGHSVAFEHRHRGQRRATRLRFSRAGTIRPGSASFRLELEPGETWHLCIDIELLVGDEVREPLLRCGGFGLPEHRMPMSADEWRSAAPRLRTDCEPLQLGYRQGLDDLAALRLRPTENAAWSVPAGGLPWFMALFGRDTIWAAHQMLPFHSELAQTTLQALAELQADADDPYRDAEPGKILHELRRGEMAALDELPHHPYYGSHDSTPLFLILLDEYHRWTGDSALVQELEPQARAALRWLEEEADLDGDGYIEYRCRSPKGLANQCWKDSDTSIRFADGRLAEPPIAVCEQQGYAYAARLRLARLARLVYSDAPLARRLERDARALRRRFNDDYWHPARRHYVLALDGEKRQVDAMTSNVGHLLWSGIVDPRRARATADRLLASDMFSGWGIRTMSTLDAAYSPVEYHNGTVWPFDSAIAAEGLRRYGFREQASRIVLGLLAAAAAFDHRLPELFAGLERDATGLPTAYPDANSPQAFSSGTPMMLLRTLLGMDADEDGLRVDPHIPVEIAAIELDGVWAHGRRHRLTGTAESAE